VAEVLETFPHIRRYQVYEHLGVFIADFGYSGDPQEDPDLEGLFADNKDRSGGTEQMVRQFRESILIDLPKFKDYRCLVIPGGIPSVEALLDGTPTIIWIHILPSQISQDAADMLKNPKFQEQVVVMVCVSEWHRDQMIKTTGIDAKKTVVIQNAIKPIISDLDRFQEKIEKPTIIHASSADRAMEILIPAAHRIAYDFDLKIFNDFDPDTAPIDRDIEGIVLDERFTYYNWTPHKTVLKYMSEAHLHAYPAYWLETSCITQIEALSSGLLCVVSDRAVLPETSMGHGMIVGFSGNREEDISNYANNLANAIKLIKAGAWRPQAQVEQIQKFFSWEKAKERWMRLHDAL
jgi:glycosyltransferase involved in cell wall biosynthesis